MTTTIDSSKELMFESELYQCGDKEITSDIKTKQKSPNIYWGTYYHFIDPGNQHMTTTKNGRIWSGIIAIFGVLLLNGLLVSSIIGWIDRRKEKWQNGDIRYNRLRYLGRYRFAVVIGANEIAASVIKSLFTIKSEKDINAKCEGKNRYVILQTSRDVQTVRAELSSHLSKAELKKVIIYKALRDSIPEIGKLRIDYSTELYILGESTSMDGGETYHDAMNMRCVNLIARNLNDTRDKRNKEKKHTGKSVRKVCKVMFEYQTTSSIFQFSDIPQIVKDNLVFIPFNRYESWARKVIVDGIYDYENSIIEYEPLDGDGIPEESSEFVHLAIVGMSKMGIAMGVETLLQAHYLNSKKARTRITFIDTHADSEMAFFKGRYANLFELIRHRYIDTQGNGQDSTYAKEWTDPMEESSGKWKHLSENCKNFLDVEIEFIKGEIESDGVRNCLVQISREQNAKLTIAICLTHTHQAVAASLYMPIDIYKSDRLQQIWVYQRESEDIISNLGNNRCNDLRYKKIRPFGMLYGEYMADRTLYLKALLVNVAYDITNGYNKAGWPNDISNKADESYAKARTSWNKLSVDKQWSNKYFADSIYIKIKNIMANQADYNSYNQIKKLLCTNYKTTICAIRKALDSNKEALAICEHNRWNIQQLLLGYSPCDKELDSIFEKIDKTTDDDAKDEYLKWKKKYLHGNICDKKIKDDVKECELRIHPNLCDYNHLSKIDSGAKQYDIDLNNAIPQIISIVDGYECDKS